MLDFRRIRTSHLSLSEIAASTKRAILFPHKLVCFCLSLLSYLILKVRCTVEEIHSSSLNRPELFKIELFKTLYKPFVRFSEECPPCPPFAGVLTSILPYGPAVAEHCILAGGLLPGRLPVKTPLSPPELASLIEGVRTWERWLDLSDTQATEGFISYKRMFPEEGVQAPGGLLKAGTAAAAADAAVGGGGGAAGKGEEGGDGEVGTVVFEEFEPLILGQHSGRQFLRWVPEPCLLTFMSRV